MNDSINTADVKTPLPAGGGGVFSKSDCLDHYNWGDGCHGWTFIETENLSIKQELMPPETAEIPHYHERATQFFFILKGRAVFIIDGESFNLREQQGIEIKPNQKHTIANRQNNDLEFILYSYPSTKNDRINS